MVSGTGNSFFLVYEHYQACKAGRDVVVQLQVNLIILVQIEKEISFCMHVYTINEEIKGSLYLTQQCFIFFDPVTRRSGPDTPRSRCIYSCFLYTHNFGCYQNITIIYPSRTIIKVF